MVSNEEVMRVLLGMKESVDENNIILNKIASTLDINNADTAEIKGVVVRGKTFKEYAIELGINVVANKL